MGCSVGDTECDDDEKPAHPVQITKGFELGKYEVTQKQWQSASSAITRSELCHWGIGESRRNLLKLVFVMETCPWRIPNFVEI
jgi:formylglycine-generating enzyme required for sulfatase activity